MSNENDNQFLNLTTIIKVLYNNILIILLTTGIIFALSVLFLKSNKQYKTEAVFYSYDKVLNEISEKPVYALNSFEFYNFFQKNSDYIPDSLKNLSEEEFASKMLKKISIQSDNGDPTVKIKFTSPTKEEGDRLAQAYDDISSDYLDTKKDNYLKTQLSILDEQYQEISKLIDLRTTKDYIADTIIARLSYYKILNNDHTPLLRLLSYESKPALNKKLILAAGLFIGLFLGVLIAFLKEFFKTLNFDTIKKK